VKQRPQFGWPTSKSRQHKKLRERFDTIYQWFLTGAVRHARGRQQISRGHEPLRTPLHGKFDW